MLRNTFRTAGFTILALCLAGISDCAWSADIAARPETRHARTYHAHRAAGPVSVDGVLDDPGWDGAAEVDEMFDIKPGDNAPPRVRTVFHMAYDSDRLYFSARCFDPEPGKIRRHLSDRDNIFKDDYVGVILDTFRDQRTGYEFFVNPLGIQGDLSRSGDNEDESFDCLWESAARVDSLGWTAEWAIPTHSLRFPVRDTLSWGMELVRVWPRESRYTLVSQRVSRDDPCSLCQASILDSLQALSVGRNLEVLPYLTQSFLGEREYLDRPFNQTNHAAVGFGVKYGVSPSLTLDAAVHPDFAQVESDQNQIDVNTQSVLFYPEKRPFFLEGANTFQFPGNMFYSRNIADPSLAVKLTGRLGKFQLGVLAARDRSTVFVHPTRDGSDLVDLDRPSSDLVARGKLGILDDSYLGFLGTARNFEGGHSLMGNLDGVIKLTRQLQWTWNAGASSTRDPSGFADNPDGTSPDNSGGNFYQELFLFSRHYNGGIWYLYEGPTYRPDLGLAESNEINQWESYDEFPFQPDGKVVEFVQPSFDLLLRKDQSGVVRSRFFHPEFLVRFRGQWEFQARSTLEHQVFFNPEIPRELIDNRKAGSVTIRKKGGGTLTGEFTIRRGEDPYYRLAVLAKVRNYDATATVRPTSQLAVDLEGHSFGLRDMDADTLLASQQVALMRASYQFTPRLFARLLLQYERRERPWKSTSKQTYKELSSQFLLSYKLNYASVFFLGFNGDHQSALTNFNGSLPGPGPETRLAARQVFAKIQYLWRY